jgi:hypothetical protein
MSNILFQPLGDPLAAGDRLESIADIDPRMTRTHYFDGRLLTAEDLERDQIYLDQRLREVGKVLGHGVIQGLELTLDRFTGLLTLQPGQAMTSAGRVLQLGSQLFVDLSDRALIAQLNDSQYRRFNRGLYAVVLRYVDVATDVAEVFPTDLASKRGSDYALITESVQLGLVPLPIPLPQQNPLHIRAGLMRELSGNEITSSLIPEDSVALGVIAIQNDTPQWLDSQLLRHPLRHENGLSHRQADLSRQYEALLADVLSARLAGGLPDNFNATDYFSLLPPVGNMPRGAVDPVQGRQGFFPDSFTVHIAPIRLADVELIKTESLGLPAIDLSLKDPVDIVVLVPLANATFGHYAAQLEREYDATSRHLPQLDLLRLKLYPVHPVHKLDTDAAIWQAIWDQLESDQLLYVRRPVRAAETAVSGIVLALGSPEPGALPQAPSSEATVPDAPPPDMPDSTESGALPPSPSLDTAGSITESTGSSFIRSPAETSEPGGLIEDEGHVLLRFINFKQLATIRPPQDSESQAALEALLQRAGDEAPTVLQANEFLLRVERQYDPVVWQTLLALVERNGLATLLAGLRDPEPEPRFTAKTVITVGEQLGLPGALLNRWESLLDRFN